MPPGPSGFDTPGGVPTCVRVCVCDCVAAWLCGLCGLCGCVREALLHRKDVLSQWVQLRDNEGVIGSIHPLHF